ncbi:unnamed protein product [Linum tenue]|uniref:Expansin-like B1 n=1 Tax=Linum tenue TaxID=586396 RepID=A0AAV0JU75_9ROSI|nr:unnamed protein product [Linum tenue]
MKGLFFGVVVCLLVLLPATIFGHDPVPVPSSPKKGRVTYYRQPDGLGIPSRACGYADTGITYNYGNVAAASSKLWKNGAACGACYKVSCGIKGVCNSQGVKIVVTDLGDRDHADFMLSSHAFEAMALPNKASRLLPKVVVDVKYERIQCKYPGHDNLMVKVTEESKFAEYLSIVLLYQGGQYDVLGIQIYDGSVKQWKDMRNYYGAVYDLPDTNPPKGPISLRLKLKNIASGGAVKLVKLDSVIPRFWKAGVAYDSKVKLA